MHRKQNFSLQDWQRNAQSLSWNPGTLTAPGRYSNSAGNWGLLDIFGGDTISGLMKHKKIGDAERYIDDAKRDLRSFSRELGNIQGIENLNIDVGGFLTFADFFFDGFLADVMVQSKINNAKKQADEAIRRVESVLGRLRTL